MKKLITFSAICIVTSVLFISCTSHLSITKRHYNNGYYVDNGKGKNSVLTAKENEKSSRFKINNTSDIDQDQKLQTVKTETSAEKTPTDNKVIAISNANVKSKTITEHDQKQTIKQNTQVVEYPVSKIKTTFSKIKNARNVKGDGEGLSLFWIIILIILILWLLGVISTGFAIGSVINLLLLAALILLILWLLRII